MQVATAVGMPVHCGQVAELTLLRGAVGGQGMLLLPLPGLAALKGRMALLLADQPLGVVVSERDLAVITGHACELTVNAPLVLLGACRGQTRWRADGALQVVRRRRTHSA